MNIRIQINKRHLAVIVLKGNLIRKVKIMQGLYNYFEISTYCKNESIAKEFFITEINKRNGQKNIKKVLLMLYSIFCKSRD